MPRAISRFAPVTQVRDGGSLVRQTSCRIAGAECDQAVRIGISQSPEQHRIPYAEDRVVRTDAHGERENCHDRRGCAVSKQSESMADLGQKAGHCDVNLAASWF